MNVNRSPARERIEHVRARAMGTIKHHERIRRLISSLRMPRPPGGLDLKRFSEALPGWRIFRIANKHLYLFLKPDNEDYNGGWMRLRKIRVFNSAEVWGMLRRHWVPAANKYLEEHAYHAQDALVEQEEDVIENQNDLLSAKCSECNQCLPP